MTARDDWSRPDYLFARAAPKRPGRTAEEFSRIMVAERAHAKVMGVCVRCGTEAFKGGLCEPHYAKQAVHKKERYQLLRERIHLLDGKTKTYCGRAIDGQLDARPSLDRVTCAQCLRYFRKKAAP